MIPSPGEPTRLFDPFDCDKVCRRDGRFNDVERASRGCTRTDLPGVTWDVDPSRLSHYLGKPRDPSRMGRHDLPGSWEYPPEDPEDGCPVGWRWNAYTQSVFRYCRKRTENGDRVRNPYFDRIGDNEVLTQAVLYFEAEEDRAYGHWMSAINEDRARQIEEQRRKAAQPH